MCRSIIFFKPFLIDLGTSGISFNMQGLYNMVLVLRKYCSLLLSLLVLRIDSFDSILYKLINFIENV